MKQEQNRTTTEKKKKGQRRLWAAGLRLRTSATRGDPGGQSFRPGAKQAGEPLAAFPSNPPTPRRSLPVGADSLTVSGPFRAWEPLPSPTLCFLDSRTHLFHI